ncbi:MAG: hypothetical protein ACXWTX_00890 [Gallionella sp.]
MAKGWTKERREKMAALMMLRKPWQRSTGARSSEGKARASRNALKPPSVRMNDFVRWMIRQLAKAQAGKPSATIEEARRRAGLRGVKF